MATCERGELKFSLHVNEFRSDFFFCFSVSKAAPTNAKGNRSKLLIISLLSFCQGNLLTKLAVEKKLNIFLPSFVYFMASANGVQF